ncbi:diguanylate cyclase domain-containing protein [Kineococcus esterisolvens]|uniref:diguanylate cyclase domain-containing protein n=1 Tax=unclassified Kineococcus TaxID=2621656 RepID=UPI003D7C78CB
MSAPDPSSPRTPRAGSRERRLRALAGGVPAAGVLGVLLTGFVPVRGAALAAGALVAAAALLTLARALVVAERSRRAVEESVDLLHAELGTVRDEGVKDAVTDLLNRRGLLLLGHQVLESARRSGGAVHACVVEVTPGVLLGARAVRADELRGQREQDWRAAATALRSATRASDVVAREGEGRFLVLGPGAGLHAQELERRVRVGLAQQRLGVGAGGGEAVPRLAVEVGAAVLAPWDDGGVADLLVRAEQSLAQRRALRRSTPQHGWGRRRGDRSAPGGTGGGASGTERPGA